MARPSNTAKLVITSIIISLIVLAVFVLIFISYIVPAYQITEEQIYSVLVKLFPVLIGLVLIQIGVMAGRRGEPDYSETIDKLAPNAYDSPLYTSPKDDPMARGKVDASALSTGTEEGAKVVERIVEKEVPVEVVKEVPVEVVREVPVEVEKPVEVVKEVEVGEKSVQLDFHQVLAEETKEALAYGYDLSIAAITGDTTEETIEASFGEDTLVFSENGLFYAVLPLYNKEEAQDALKDFSIVNIATLDGRDIAPDDLIQEASRA